MKSAVLTLGVLGFGFCLGNVQAASIVVHDLSQQYRWNVYADADVGGTHFFESDSAPLTTATSGTYSGSVDSPIPNKIYDTSPVNFLQPDGSFATNISFAESWTGASASVESNASLSSDSSTFSLSIGSESQAYSSNSSAWKTGVGQAQASSDIYLSTLFSVSRDSGDGDSFTLDIDFIDSAFVDVLANISPTEIWDVLTIETGALLRDTTSSQTLLDFDYQYVSNPVAPGTPWLAPGFVPIDGLSFDHQYFFQIYLSTSAEAFSDYEIIFEDPTCNPSVDTCVVQEWRYENMRSLASARGDFDLGVTASVVPVPAAVWLFATALAGLFGITRREKIKHARLRFCLS